ncbi:MAG: methylaspartate ammonia-lyase [Chloroflexi bacterium]|nr:methylaspartate ammonia-lyase [Chloroflexota bacterium]
MKISKVVCAPGLTGFFSDDQLAIRHSEGSDGFTYLGKPMLPGFTAIRQAGECVSILLLLEDGQVAYGDCASVQYAGAGGRYPLFLTKEYIPVINRVLKPKLEGRELTTFRDMAEEFDSIRDPETGGLLHSAIRYGVTQALLDAVGKATHKLMVDVIAEEYGTQPAAAAVPIFVQSGDDRYVNADKMILKAVPVLPHGLINNVRTKLGPDGEIFLEYASWLRRRIEQLKPYAEYQPVLHFDVYGTIGLAFNNNDEKILSYLSRLAEAVAPLRIRIEGPVDVGDQMGQLEALARLRKKIDDRHIPLEIVADEWCNTLEDIKLFTDNGAGHMIQTKTPDLGGINNTIEAIIYCRSHGMGAYVGGTCNETDRSGQVCTHIGMATQPDQVLAKPGMGVDEGYMIVVNEMSRILALKAATA